MRRPNEEHEAGNWRVHEIASEFELLDVWRFPISIAPEIPFSEFPTFLNSALADLVSGSGPAALLFRLRGWLGRVFGWDPDRGTEPDAQSGIEFRLRFEWENEGVSEIENETVHALMHLGRFELDPTLGEASRWSPQMAVYVKPKGAFGRAYMTAIGPFRHLIVYPAMMRAVERAWPAYLAERARKAAAAGAAGAGG